MKLRPLYLILLGMILALNGVSIVGVGAFDNRAGLHTEQALWKSSLLEQTELEKRKPLLDHSGIQRYVDGIVTRLWKQVQTDLPPMRVRLLADSEADAFAYPNGICYLTSGMLLHTRNQDQLAMIIAHEMIHYTQRHAWSVFRSAEVDRRSSHAPEISSPKDVALSQMVATTERQADQEGFLLISQAGYCPDEALSILAGFQSQGTISSPMRFSGQRFHSQANHRVDGVQMVSNHIATDQPCRVDPLIERFHVEQIAPALKANAQQAIEKGRWNLAAESITKYLSVRPDDPQGYFIRGELLRLGFAGENNHSPEAAYQRAIELDRGFVPAYQALGVVFFKNGQKAKAKQLFEHCLALSPAAEDRPYIKRYVQLCSE